MNSFISFRKSKFPVSDNNLPFMLKILFTSKTKIRLTNHTCNSVDTLENIDILRLQEDAFDMSCKTTIKLILWGSSGILIYSDLPRVRMMFIVRR